MKSIVWIIGICASLAMGSLAQANTPVRGVEKIAVFPLQFVGERGEKMDEATASSLDDAWWQVREELTSTGRFLVASRSFLQKADAFQPRGILTSADAVILGRYVEAEMVMTLFLKERSLTVSAWDTAEGALAWSQSVDLHPSVLIREQIARVARALVREFIAAIPYQGTTVQDSMARQAVYDDGGKKRARVRVGTTESLSEGDLVQWVSLNRTTLEPLFEGGARSTVMAEGKIVAVKDQQLTVELTRVADLSFIKAGALVQIPKEFERLQKWAKPREAANSAAMVSAVVRSGLASGNAEPEGLKEERKWEEKKPMVTTLSILGSLAVILLLAF